MSDTPEQNETPQTPATEGTEPPAPAAASSSSEPAASASGAVDTGRRIDPALLQRGNPNQRPLRRGREAPPESAIEAPEGVDENSGHVRVVAPAADGNRARGRDRPQYSGAVVDAATIAARAAGNEPAREERAPRPDGPPRGDGDRGPPRGDRGPPRGAGGGGGGRGPRPAETGPGGKRLRPGERKVERGPGEQRRGPSDNFSGLAPIVVQQDADVGDFAAMLAAEGAVQRRDVRIGDKVRALCVHVGSDAVFFELSKTQQAHAARAEFLDEKSGEMTIAPGDSVDLFVVAFKDGVLLSPKIGRDQIDVGMLEQARISGIPIDGTVTGVNKGGFEISISGNSRGFCPLGQIDIHFVDDPTTLIGKTLAFLVKEVKEGGKNVVLSRRALLEKERNEKAGKLRETLAVGQIIDGVVTRIQPFGAFVDLGGIDGLVPVSELAYGRVQDPNEIVKVGEQVKVEITRIEDDPHPKRQGQLRIGLSMKAMQQDPLVERMNELSPGAQFVGRVMRLEPFGAFVEIFPGVEGLVHVSEISDRRIRHPEDVLKVDEHVQVRVKDVDLPRRRVSLSMREAQNDEPIVQTFPDPNEHQQSSSSSKPRLARGTRVVGVVERIERYGVFINCYPEGADPSSAEKLGTALMPASETGTPRGADLGKAFPIGTQVSALIIDIDERGRLKASKTAREQAEERALVDEYKKDKGQGTGAGLGTFGDLLKKFGAK
ncbi:MAG: S1 RNA-binding domain-containing protein [Deltaproteobacteria bacterium]|nr:S1 RNA-binding domain-containing protein [Deltaproteobacteria bacterium]